MSQAEPIGQLDALTKRYVNHFLLEPAREDRGSSMLPRKNSSAAMSPFGGSRSGANIARRRAVQHRPRGLLTPDPELAMELPGRDPGLGVATR